MSSPAMPADSKSYGARSWRWVIVAGTLLITAGIALYFTHPKQGITPVADVRPLEVLENGYVSSQSCQACHQREFESWHSSYHRTMTQKIDPATVPEFLVDSTVTVDGKEYRFEKSDGQVWVELNSPVKDDGEDSGKRIRRRIVLSTGSHHMQVFWFATERGRTLVSVPIIYLLDEKRWIPRKSAFLRPPQWPPSSELGRWNLTCLKCHSTNPRPRPRRDNHWDTHVAEFGIACEACHGPGAGHVQAKSAKVVDTNLRDVIVNPKKLPHQRASETCGQCHSIRRGVPDLHASLEFLEHGARFRPGQKYEDVSYFRFTRCSAGFEDPNKNDNLHSFWSDGMVRVSGREFNGLLETPCYQRGKLSCTSCHTMHDTKGHTTKSEWANDQLQIGMRGNRACLQCHKTMADNIEAHTHHPAKSSGSNCMNCHMPHTTYGLLKAIRSHQIDSPRAATTLETGRINACNQCHLDRSLKWTAGHLAKWYEQEPPVIPKEHQNLAVSVLQSLKGDAGQRALVAWSFGWKSPRAVTNPEWMVPLLLTLMNDDYDAVRIVAYRSLRKINGYGQFEFDPIADVEERQRITTIAIDKWRKARQIRGRPETLFDSDGNWQYERYQQLLKSRDNRPVNLAE